MSEAGRLMEQAKLTAEDETFANAKSTKTVEAYQQYLAAYPDGRHSNEAQRLLAVATRAEVRQRLVDRLTRKSFSGTDKYDDYVTYRFSSNGKLRVIAKAASFFGIPGDTETCVGSWHVDGDKFSTTAFGGEAPMPPVLPNSLAMS